MNRVGVILAGRYELMELLGSGGMADVYKASDRKLNRYVAVKILRQEYSSDESFIMRFQQEAMAAASIQNPYVVNVYDVGAEDDINYIVMELAEGVTLKDYIQKKGKLEIVDAINIAVQIVSGIREAHMHRIIHRDIKPQNIMVAPDGKTKVMDFGIARAVTAQTITANTVGSVHYISPEQARGIACDERCDIYSIGITMYEMITGRVPFDGDSTVAIALAHIKEPITPPSVYEPMIPVSLEKIIMKCTQKKPELRYASADELIDDLKKALMTPDEDFVKEVVIAQEGGTRVFSEEDTRKIKEESGKISLKTQEEENYQLGLEDNDDLDDLPADDEEADGKMEKVVLFIGIGALLVVLLIAGLLIGRAFNLFSFPSLGLNGTETTAGEELAADEVRMPAVEGKTEEEAIELLKVSSLGYKIVKESSDKVDAGKVISASVEEGTILQKHTQVILTVSSGIDTRIIPNIIGENVETAKKALEKTDLEVKVEEEASEDTEKDHVIRCNPEVGESVEIGTVVTLYISTGAKGKTVAVPRLVENPLETAQDMLDNAGLECGEIKEEYSERVAGTVISQSPSYGVKVEEGTKIDIVVSLGPKKVTTKVPNVKGMKLESAKTEILAANLRVGSVDEEYNDSVPAGQVINQSIAAESEVEENTTVNLTVSLGPQETSTEAYVNVPSIVGLSESEALAKLAEAGLSGRRAGTEDGTQEAGQVTRVVPGVGSSVEKGSTVEYYVSTGVNPNAEE